MPTHTRSQFTCRALVVAALVAFAGPVDAQVRTETAPVRDGQRDFDFELGTWHTHLMYRAPLDSTATWIEYSGTSVVSALLGGRANVVELDVSGPSGRITGMNLRLYDAQAREWSLNFASGRSGALSPPVRGAFRDGRGEFIGLEEHEGRAVLVRFVIQPITADSIRFEQSYSGDHGRTWIPNWIATDARRR